MKSSALLIALAAPILALASTDAVDTNGEGYVDNSSTTPIATSTFMVTTTLASSTIMSTIAPTATTCPVVQIVNDSYAPYCDEVVPPSCGSDSYGTVDPAGYGTMTPTTGSTAYGTMAPDNSSVTADQNNGTIRGSSTSDSQRVLLAGSSVLLASIVALLF